jgi:hypothetical protein
MKASEGVGVTPTTRIVSMLMLLAGCFEDAFVCLSLAQHFFREVIAEGVDETCLGTSWAFG